jgi:hypothetical protein
MSLFVRQIMFKAKVMSVLSVFILGSLMGQFLKAENFNQNKFYRVRIPAQNLTCQEESRNMGQKLEKLLKKIDLKSKVINFNCEGEFEIERAGVKYKFFNISAEYNTTALQVPIYTANLALMLDTITSLSRGFYPSMKECFADVATRTAEFQKFTGLESLSAQCEFDLFSQKNNHVKMIIESIGIPKLTLNGISFIDTTFVDTDYRKFVSELIKFNNGNEVYSGTDGYLFYSTQKIAVTPVNIGLMNLNECESQKSILQKYLKTAQNSVVLVQCQMLDPQSQTVRMMGFEKSYRMYYLREATENNGNYEGKIKNFYSYNECISAKSYLDKESTDPGFCVRNLLNDELYNYSRIRVL